MTDITLFWWVLSGLSVSFLLIDWAHAPIDVTMHVGFLLIAAFMGPLGAVMYVLTVREPLPGTHQAYIRFTWKQVVGSTFHCVAGDSVGIVGAAVVTSLMRVPMVVEVSIEYIAGFLVGWLFFQAFFMKSMVGGSYRKAVQTMFMPEWLSMNGVMAGMAVVMVMGIRFDPQTALPSHAPFWFLMSLALVAGAIVTYPINWWLVDHKLKHGLMSLEKGQMPSHDTPAPVNAMAAWSTSPVIKSHAIHTMDHPGSVSTRLHRPYHSSVVWISLVLLLTALAIAAWF